MNSPHSHRFLRRDLGQERRGFEFKNDSTEEPASEDETLGGGAADLEAARRVFRLESEGISALADALDDNFLAAVGMLSRGYRPGDCYGYGEERTYRA